MRTPEFFEAVKQWQRKQGTTCSVCHQNNIQTECAVCHWWGKVAPQGFKLNLAFPAPLVKDFQIN